MRHVNCLANILSRAKKKREPARSPFIRIRCRIELCRDRVRTLGQDERRAAQVEPGRLAR
jgi:hypothetical protein